MRKMSGIILGGDVEVKGSHNLQEGAPNKSQQLRPRKNVTCPRGV
jgi:hypothetical protein